MQLQFGGVTTMIVTVVCVSLSAWFQLGLTSKSALFTEVVQCFSVFWLRLDKDVVCAQHQRWHVILERQPYC